MNDLKKKENESQFQFIKRIVYGKLIDKTIDEDFCELSELVFGEGNKFNSSEVRKRFYGLRYLFELIDKEQITNIKDDEVLNELELKRLEIEKERKKLQTTKIELNRNLRLDGRQELFYENIKDAKDRLPLPKFEELSYMESDGEYILAWADLHYGADFVSENNTYSREECKRRFEKMISKVDALIDKNNINTLNIFSLGDDIQGLLRISDVKLNDIPVVESVVEVSRLIATVLNELSKKVNVTYYHTMYSNHSQTRPITGKPDLPREDLEFVIGNYIKDLVSNNPRIEVVLTDKEYHSMEILGQNILSLHGHQLKGIKNAIKDYSMLHRKFYDICFTAHFHAGQQMSVSESENGNTEIVVVPSFVGSDPYSDRLKLGSKAMAKLYKIEKGLGITENYTMVLN